jgi:probable HAF family extracellular repeat protein
MHLSKERLRSVRKRMEGTNQALAVNRSQENLLEENMKTLISCSFYTRSMLNVGFLCLLLLSAAKGEPRYAITDLGILSGGSYSVANGINNRGQVVGISETAVPAVPPTSPPTFFTFPHAFLYSGGHMQDLGTFGGFQSVANGINDLGQVVGQASYSDGIHGDTAQRAFLYSGGHMQDLGTLGGFASYASGINNRGQVVGQSWINGDTEHAFLYSGGHMVDIGGVAANGINDLGQVVGDNGSGGAFLYSGGHMQDLGTLGGVSANALGINNGGQIVGWSYINSVEVHAFLYSGGHMQDLGTLGGSNSEANGINNRGQVVGGSTLVAGFKQPHYAFLYSGSRMLDLNYLLISNPGWILTYAIGINDVGQIVGSGTVNGQGHAFLLTPVSR